MIIGKKNKKCVEDLLIKDLAYHGVNDISVLFIDWNSAVGESGGVTFNGEYVEGASDVLVRNSKGEKVFCGWTDYIVDSNGKLHAYWTMLNKLLCAKDYDLSKFEGNGFGIPVHIWSALTEESKKYLAENRQGWHGDINLLPYRLAIIPDLIKNKISEYKSIDIGGLKRLNSGIDIDFLVSEMEKHILYSEKVLKKEETNPDEILTYLYEVHSQINDLEEVDREAGKKIKQLYDIVDSFYLLISHAELIYRIAKKK